MDVRIHIRSTKHTKVASTSPENTLSTRREREIVEQLLKGDVKTINKSDRKLYASLSPAVKRRLASKPYIPYKPASPVVTSKIRKPIIVSEHACQRILQKGMRTFHSNNAVSSIRSLPAISPKVHCLVNYNIKPKIRLKCTLSHASDNEVARLLTRTTDTRNKGLLFPLESTNVFENYKKVLKGSVYRLQTYLQNAEVARLKQFSP